MPEKEYIERECAYKACEKYFNGVCGYDVSESEVINDFEKIIDSVPAADVAPVRHGYWVKEKRDVLIHWHCSACKECFYLDMPNAEYCPHCGAKMDLKERDEND